MTRKEVSFLIYEGVVSRKAVYHSIVEHNKLIVRGREVLLFGSLALEKGSDLIVYQIKVPGARASELFEGIVGPRSLQK